MAALSHAASVGAKNTRLPAGLLPNRLAPALPETYCDEMPMSF
jgi:hypothetical protein